MQKNSKLILLVIITSITLFFYYSENSLGISEKIRNLQSSNRQAVIEVCTTSKNTTFGFTIQFQGVSNTLADYIALANSETKRNDDLIAILQNSGNQVALRNYVQGRLAPYIIFIVFGILTLIGWAVCCCCCCKPCCCCAPVVDETKSTISCRSFSALMVLLLSSGVLICCVIGFVFSGQVVQNMKGFSCNLLYLYYDVTEGELKTTTPRWIGIQGIIDTLEDTKVQIDKIANDADETFRNLDTSWTTQETANFQDNLTIIYNDNKDKTLPNPNPKASTRGGVTVVAPTYISNLGPYNSTNTLLGGVYVEFDTKIAGSVKLVNQLKNNSDQIKENSNTAKDGIDNVINELKPLQDQIETLNRDIIVPFNDVRQSSEDNANTGFLILFALIFVLVSIAIVATCLFACCTEKCYCMKYFAHTVWCILALLTVLTFIVGSIFGLIGVVAEDVSPTMEYLFSRQNLENDKVIFTDGQAIEILDTCMNKGGNLSSVLLDNNTGTEQITTFYNLAAQIRNNTALIKNNSNSVAIERINSDLTLMKTDIIPTGESDANSPASVLEEWRYYTDSNANNPPASTCSSKTQDIFVQTQDKCLPAYTYVAPSTPNSGIGSPSCLVFPEFTDTAINARYSTRPSGCQVSGDFTSVVQAVLAYSQSVNDYAQQNGITIEAVIDDLSPMDQEFVRLSLRVSDILDKIQGFIDPLLKLFESILGDSGFDALINCSFMAKNLGQFFNTLSNELGPSCINTASIIIAVSLMNCLIIIFLMIVIFRYDTKNIAKVNNLNNNVPNNNNNNNNNNDYNNPDHVADNKAIN